MWDLIFKGILAIIGGFTIAAAITAVAWTISDIINSVVSYLKSKSRQAGIVRKKSKLTEMINSTNDSDIKKELREIRDNSGGLLIPLDNNAKPCFDEIKVIQADNSSKDTMSDETLIFVDGTYKNL
ncbi:MAG: hypothetical protein K5787_19050 [Lentisphaeria bacterium]|nr:hypothetical protein [Lentisphaeria bacterium]